MKDEEWILRLYPHRLHVVGHVLQCDVPPDVRGGVPLNCQVVVDVRGGRVDAQVALDDAALQGMPSDR